MERLLLERKQRRVMTLWSSRRSQTLDCSFMLRYAHHLAQKRDMKVDRGLFVQGIPVIDSWAQVPDDPYQCKCLYRFEKQHLKEIVSYLLPFVPKQDGYLRWPHHTSESKSSPHRYNLLESLLGSLNQMGQLETLFS